MAKQRGFSVLELLVVVAIILILSGIAAALMRNARIAAVQASAVASLRTINTAEAMYVTAYPAVGYAPDLAHLGRNGGDCQYLSSHNACMLDSSFAEGPKNGYLFELVGDGKTPDTAYTVTATPQPGSGNCAFSSDQTGRIKNVASGSSSGFSEAPDPLAGCPSL